jgi:transaldolase
MAQSALRRLEELGQSVWLDYLDHDLIASGELGRLVAEDGLRGITSNPTIFEKAITSSRAYDALLEALPADQSDARALERIMVRELTLACDELRKSYEESDGADGFASIEIAPGVAHDTARSVEQARRLWSAVGRPNLMVKIPATREGVPAIEAALSAGININVTLLFSVHRYLEVAEAHLRALERRVSRGQSIHRLASVASFFVSRVDAKVDRALDAIPNALSGEAGALRGQIAIANAQIAYEAYERLTKSARFTRLEAEGARPQRLLWASTSPKDPRYPETYYAEALIAPNTIDTMTPACLRAYRASGRPEPRLVGRGGEAHETMERLTRLGIDLEAITRQLEEEGVQAFASSYRRSLQQIAKKRQARIVGSPMG